jgi:hypothetical protein
MRLGSARLLSLTALIVLTPRRVISSSLVSVSRAVPAFKGRHGDDEYHRASKKDGRRRRGD